MSRGRLLAITAAIAIVSGVTFKSLTGFNSGGESAQLETPLESTQQLETLHGAAPNSAHEKTAELSAPAAPSWRFPLLPARPRAPPWTATLYGTLAFCAGMAM